MCVCCVYLPVCVCVFFSFVQPYSCGPQSRRHSVRENRVIHRHEWGRPPVHISKHRSISFSSFLSYVCVLYKDVFLLLRTKTSPFHHYKEWLYKYVCDRRWVRCRWRQIWVSNWSVFTSNETFSARVPEHVGDICHICNRIIAFQWRLGILLSTKSMHLVSIHQVKCSQSFHSHLFQVTEFRQDTHFLLSRGICCCADITNYPSFSAFVSKNEWDARCY